MHSKCCRYMALSGLLVSLLFLLVTVDSTRVFRGLVTGEAFYRNRPASYWGIILKQHCDKQEAIAPGLFERILIQLGLCLDLSGKAQIQQFLSDPAAIPVLEELLANDSLPVRWKASLALLRLNARRPIEVIGIMSEAVHGLPEYDDRVEAGEALERLGPEAAPASLGLVLALGDKGPEWSYYDDEPLYERAARILVLIGPPAIPALVEGLQSEDPSVRARAARILDEIKGGKRKMVRKKNA